jgi:hypothetical protein
LRETLSGDRVYRLEQFSGTPLTLDNTIEKEWLKTSMAEWAIKCTGCGHTNLAGKDHDLMKMIGLRGLVCSKCDTSLNTRAGYWYHTIPERRSAYVGYHAPQVIFPMHCESPRAWMELLTKRNGHENAFMNEVLGESCDTGSKLVTTAELRDACVLPWENDFKKMLAQFEPNQYSLRVLAVDWSGGGSDLTSKTAMVTMGLRQDGKIDVLWARKYEHTTEYLQDALRCIEAWKMIIGNFVVHDFGGAGNLRESILVHAGFPLQSIIPVTLVRASGSKAMMTYNPPENKNVRRSFSLDKSRSLVYTCELIKNGYIRFPKWETVEYEISDFLALSEEVLITPRGSDIYMIGRAQNQSDDIAQAINIGACAMYYSIKQWPNLAGARTVTSVAALLEADPSILKNAADQLSDLR